MVLNARRALARVERCVRHVLSNESMKGHRISDEQVLTLEAMRSAFLPFDKFVQEALHVFDDDEIWKNELHIPTIAALVNMRSFQVTASVAQHSLEQQFSKTWSSDLLSLIKAIDSLSPKWLDADREVLLNDRAFVQAMLDAKYDQMNVLSWRTSWRRSASFLPLSLSIRRWRRMPDP
mgnify:CR=1 FL=1